MLHQFFEDGRAFLPQEQLSQTSCVKSVPSEEFGCERRFLASGTYLLHATSSSAMAE